MTGDVSDSLEVEYAVHSHDAVISALGASTPFKRNFTLIKGVENIVSAMVKHHVKRFIYQSFLGVSEHREDLGFLLNNIVPWMLVNVIKDHGQKEKLITSSNLNWTIIRCGTLTNGDLTKKYKVGERIYSSAIPPTISRADVADFMLRQLNDTMYFHKSPRIMRS